MLDIEAINHVGIRISDREASVAFYERLGFQTIEDAGFSDGHPIIMRSPAGVVFNLLGPATIGQGSNVLMDSDQKYPGITHFALTVTSLSATRAFLESAAIPITGSFSFGNMSAVFIRDPDRNVIELDAYDEEPGANSEGSGHPS